MVIILSYIDECFFENKHFKDLNPRGVGYEQCAPGHSCGPEQRSSWVIHYIISGQGFLRINHKTYTITKNNMFIIPKNTLFYYQTDTEDPWEYTWLSFDGEYADRLYQLKLPVVPIDGKYFENLLECKKYIGMESEYLASRLWLIFSQFFKNKKYDYVAIAREYLTNNYMHKVSIKYIADNIGINKRYLSRIFKETIGQTMQDYLISLRMNKAKSLIVNHNYSVNLAATMVGYDDPYAFSKIFKKYFGNSPSYYVNKLTSDDI